jgi:membrane protease YdiL (CAAX protease family)
LDFLRVDFGTTKGEILSGGILSLFKTAIVAPFAEEFLYRGLIFQGFVRRYNPKKAVLLTSLLFAVVHLTPLGMFNSFISGLFLAWLLLETRSLWPCIAAHCISNGIVYFQTIAEPVFNIEILGYTVDNGSLFNPLWFNIMGLVFLTFGGMLLIRTLRKNRSGIALRPTMDVRQEPVR